MIWLTYDRPGETLAGFLPYTHSSNGSGGLKPYNSVRNVLERIPERAPNHDVDIVTRRGAFSFVPWDDSGILTSCITTGGSDGKGHPSGKRGFTNRELASLQGFPHGHVFEGLEIRKQIGNAVPASIAKLWFRHIRMHLERVDRAEMVRLDSLNL